MALPPQQERQLSSLPRGGSGGPPPPSENMNSLREKEKHPALTEWLNSSPFSSSPRNPWGGEGSPAPGIGRAGFAPSWICMPSTPRAPVLPTAPSQHSKRVHTLSCFASWKCRVWSSLLNDMKNCGLQFSEKTLPLERILMLGEASRSQRL